ncbi:MAG: helix-turn-helix domain-containing protein [Flavobacterium sp.]|jgi:transcriptional regulator with XRE-family HTH domain
MENEEQLFLSKFGNRLREIRLAKNLSQEMLANDADIPINQVGRIERAEISTSLNTIYKIAKALEIDIKELFDF